MKKNHVARKEFMAYHSIRNPITATLSKKPYYIHVLYNVRKLMK